MRPKTNVKLNAKRIVEHLCDMIPTLDLNNYKLKEKPCYLRKLRRRKAARVDVSSADISVVEVEQNQLKDCYVRLVCCDHMLNEEQIRLMKKNKQIATNKNEDQHNDKNKRKNNKAKQNATKNERRQSQYDAQNEKHDFMSLIDLTNVDPVPTGDRNSKHQNDNVDEIIVATIVISSDDEEPNTEKQSEQTQPRQSPINSPEKANTHFDQSSDDDLCTFRNQPPTRTYLKRKQYFNKRSSSSSRTTLIGKKSYDLLHKFYAYRNGIADGNTTDSSYQTDNEEPKTQSNAVNPQSDDADAAKTDKEVNDTETDTEQTDMEIDESCDRLNPPLESNCTNTTDVFVSPVELHKSSSTEEIPKLNTETECQMKPNQVPQKHDNEFDSNETRNLNGNSELNDQSATMQEANIDQLDTAVSSQMDQHTQDVRSEEPQYNEHIQEVEISTNQDSSTQETNERETIQSSPNLSQLMKTAVLSLPIQSANDLNQSLTNDCQQDIAELQNRMLLMENKMKQTIEQLTQLQNDIKEEDKEFQVLKEQKNELNTNNLDYNLQIQNAIRETKNKKWCTNCRAEAKSVIFQPPVCSANCLRAIL